MNTHTIEYEIYSSLLIKTQYTTVHHVMMRLERPNTFYTIKKTGHLETKLFCLDWCVPITVKRKFL
jgi:hypothetical protein